MYHQVKLWFKERGEPLGNNGGDLFPIQQGDFRGTALSTAIFFERTHDAVMIIVKAVVRVSITQCANTIYGSEVPACDRKIDELATIVGNEAGMSWIDVKVKLDNSCSPIFKFL